MSQDEAAAATENHQSTFAATLADEWVRQGLTDAVICPGSRSTPLAVALARQSGLRVHVCHDERGGGFVALGLAMASGRAALVLTTSGTAAVELHPAVVEAHHAAVPMLAVTADRPAELQGVGAPQTIDQQRLFGPAVRWFCQPGAPEPWPRDGWRHLAADTLAATRGVVPGPVHLNLAFREPLVGPAGGLPEPDPTTHRPLPHRWNVPDEALARIGSALAHRRGVIVAGVRSVLGTDDRAAVLDLAEQLGWPVLADHQSGLRVDHRLVVAFADPVLRHAPSASRLQPEAVLRIGGLHASRVVNEWLAGSRAVQVGLDRYGLCPDPDRVLWEALDADVADACRGLAVVTLAAGHLPDAGWVDQWRRVSGAAAAVVSGEPTGEIGAVGAALRGVPAGGSLVVSSSMPVRDLEWYTPGRSDVTVCSNRGANGIDGVLATAVGVALGGGPTVCVLGDIALLHDSSSLGALAARDVQLAIVVIDNGGGGIFSFLPQADALGPAEFEQLFGTPHGTNFELLAAAHGIGATAVSSTEALSAALDAWRSRGGVEMLVVGSTRDANRAHHAQINAAVAAALDRVWNEIPRDG